MSMWVFQTFSARANLKRRLKENGVKANWQVVYDVYFFIKSK